MQWTLSQQARLGTTSGIGSSLATGLQIMSVKVVIVEPSHGFAEVSAADHTLTHELSTPWKLMVGDYIWLGLRSNQSNAHASVVHDASGVETTDLLDFVGWTQADDTGTPTDALTGNLWHSNAQDSAFHARFEFDYDVTAHTFIEKDGFVVNASNHLVLDFQGDNITVGRADDGAKTTIQVTEPTTTVEFDAGGLEQMLSSENLTVVSALNWNTGADTPDFNWPTIPNDEIWAVYVEHIEHSAHEQLPLVYFRGSAVNGVAHGVHNTAHGSSQRIVLEFKDGIQIFLGRTPTRDLLVSASEDGTPNNGAYDFRRLVLYRVNDPSLVIDGQVSTTSQAALDGKADRNLGNINPNTTESAAARTALGLGTAATRNTGTGENNIPLLGSDGELDSARLGSGSTVGNVLTLTASGKEFSTPPSNYRGDYSATETYYFGDYVRVAPAYWMSISDNHSGNTPVAGSVHWDEITGLIPEPTVSHYGRGLQVDSSGDYILSQGQYRGAYDAAVTYAQGDVTHNSSTFWRSLSANNTGNEPSTVSTEWERDSGFEGSVTHIESGATYNNNVITVSTTGTVRGGDGILFTVPSPFGTSTTQAVSLAIDGQANSEHPLHDRNGDAIHEADLTVNSVYIATSDADSWDILILPAGGAVIVQDEGVERTANLEIINFTGTGVQASGANGTVTVNIGDNPADNEVQVASSPLWQSANTRIQVTLDKHPADGDIFSFTVPSDIDTTSTTDISLRVTDGSTFSAVRNMLGLDGSNLNPTDLTAGRRIYVQRVGIDYVVLSPLEEGSGDSIGNGEIIVEDTSFAWISTSPAAGDAATTMFRLDRALTEADHGKLFAPSIRFDDDNAADDSRFPLPPIDAKFIRALVGAQTAWPGGGNSIPSNIDATPVQFLAPRFWTMNGFGHAIWNLYYSGSAVALLSSSATLGSITLSVTSTTGLAAGDHIFIDNERIEITSVDSAIQLTVVATTAAHSANARFFLDDGRTFFFTQSHTQQDGAADIEIILVGGGAADEGGQESPGTEGVAVLTAGLVRTTFYAYATSAKDAPTSSWRFDDEWSGDAPGAEGWYTSEDSALTNAMLDPDFATAGYYLQIATEQVRRRVVNEAYSYTDSGWTVTAAWDVQYSTDGSEDHETYNSSEDNYVRYRDEDGGLGPWILIGSSVGNNNFEPKITGENVYPGNQAFDSLVFVEDMSQIVELLFEVTGFRNVTVMVGGESVVQRHEGPYHTFVLHRFGGWPTVISGGAGDNNNPDASTFQFKYLSSDGLDIWQRGDAVNPNVVSFIQGNDVPPTQYGGMFKFVSPEGEENDVTSIRFFNWSDGFARGSWTIKVRYI